MLLSPSRYGPGLLTPQSKFQHRKNIIVCFLPILHLLIQNNKQTHTHSHTHTRIIFLVHSFILYSVICIIVVAIFNLFSIVPHTSRASSLWVDGFYSSQILFSTHHFSSFCFSNEFLQLVSDLTHAFDCKHRPFLQMFGEAQKKKIAPIFRVSCQLLL